MSSYISGEAMIHAIGPFSRISVEVLKRYAEYLVNWYGWGDLSYFYVVERKKG